MNAYISLSYVDVILASVFLFLNALFSILLQLRLERQLVISAMRMVVQLLMVGLVLKTVFAVADEHVVLLYGFVKKTRKTPKPDSDLAAWRLKEVAS